MQSSLKNYKSQCALGFLLLLGLSGCGEREQVTYYTWEGLGPDKWASAWLIHRYAVPGTQIEVIPAGSSAPNPDRTFDFPGAKYLRVGDQTTFEQITSSWSLDAKDPALSRMATIINDIEVNFWGNTVDPVSDYVEAGFRALQRNSQGKPVPQACYFSFFDRVLATAGNTQIPASPETLLPDESCFSSDIEATASANNQFIPQLPVKTIAESVASGRKVAFIDVREPWEFRENHIPNAVNVPLRNIDSLKPEDFADYDYVVAYCVKDFRGFEMAKALKLNGFNNAVILEPFGIKGWVSEGLPVMRADGMTDEEAFQQLKRCGAQTSNCQTEG